MAPKDQAFPKLKELIEYTLEKYQAFLHELEGHGAPREDWPEDWWCVYNAGRGNGFDLNLWVDEGQPTITIYPMVDEETCVDFGISIPVELKVTKKERDHAAP